MALPTIQKDRFNQVIPACPGYTKIQNPDGTWPRMRNTIILDSTITASDDDVNQATLLHANTGGGGAVDSVVGSTNIAVDSTDPANPVVSVTGAIPVAHGGTGSTTAAGARTNLGAGTGNGDALTANPLSQFAPTTSAQLAGVLSDETGTGLAVFNTSPTLVTPTLGAAAATSVNKVAITAPATSATFTIADGKTLSVPNNATVSGTNTGDQVVPAVPALLTRTTDGTLSFTGLTGDAAGVFGYRLSFNFKFSGSVPVVKLRLNADTGNNYATGYQGTLIGFPLVLASNGATAADGIQVNTTATGTGIVAGTIDVIYPKSGVTRVANFQSLGQEDTNSYPSIRSGSGYWTNTADQITSIQLDFQTGGGTFTLASASLTTLVGV